jgi:multidrug efflux system outer membrane protein
MSPIRKHVLITASVILMAGCFGERAKPDIQEIVEMPASFTAPESAQETMQKVPLDRWCSDFGQAELDRLVELAFQKNLNLMASWARLEQSAALLAQTNSNRMPQVNLDGQASRTKSPAFGGQDLPGVPTSFTNNFYKVEGNVAYEIDLWGKLAAQRQAAALDYKASRADVEAAALSLTSSVAEAWFDVLAQHQKYDLLQTQIDLNARYVELLELRFEQGLSSVLDINQQRQQIQQLKGQQRTITQQRVLAEQRLAVLIGEAPMNTEQLFSVGESTLPNLTSLPDAGIPADLLERRPDLRAASIRLEATNERIAVAVRERLPTLRLSAATFLQALTIGRLVDDIFWTIAGAASAPIFDGGRRRAEVVRAEAAQKEAYYTYGNTLLTALSEVQGAIVSEHYQAEFIEDLKTQREIADISLTLSRERYQRGNFDFLRVLTSLQSLQQIEQSIVDAQRRQLSNRLQLCRALGGTWTQSIEPSSAQ